MTDAPRHNRLGLFIPFLLVGLAIAAWTGWWFYLVQRIEQGVDVQAQALRQQGWGVAYVQSRTTGWPFRARIAFDHVRIAAPSGHGLAAPELVAEANAYNPDRWVMVASDGLTLTRGAGKGEVGVRGRALRASISGLSQAYPNIAVAANEPVFTTLIGAEPFPLASAERVEFYLRPRQSPEDVREVDAIGRDSVDVLFRLIDGRGRSGGPVAALSAAGQLDLNLETTVRRFSALKGPDATALFRHWSAAGGVFDRVRGEARAGDSSALISSDRLSVGADGRLAGAVALKARQPLAALAGLARAGGVSAPAAAGVAAGVVVDEASQPEAGRDVDLTLIFQDGRTYLGPFDLAPAPRLF